MRIQRYQTPSRDSSIDSRYAVPSNLADSQSDANAWTEGDEMHKRPLVMLDPVPSDDPNEPLVR